MNKTYRIHMRDSARKSGNFSKIDAIKALRSLTGMGLKETNDAITSTMDSSRKSFSFTPIAGWSEVDRVYCLRLRELETAGWIVTEVEASEPVQRADNTAAILKRCARELLDAEDYVAAIDVLTILVRYQQQQTMAARF